MLEYVENDVVFKVGKNSRENWELIGKSQPQDMWFHLEGHPSPHVVMTTPLQGANKRDIMHAAFLCKLHSKFKDHHRVSVIYTEIKYVKLGEKEGSVIPKRVRKVCV